MSDFSEREPHTFFGYLAVLNTDERNDLDEYLRGLPVANVGSLAIRWQSWKTPTPSEP